MKEKVLILTSENIEFLETVAKDKFIEKRKDWDVKKKKRYAIFLEEYQELWHKLFEGNQIYKDFIKEMGYSDVQIAMIKNNEKVHLEAKCLSLQSNGLKFNAKEYCENDILDAIFLIGKDLVSVYVTQLNQVSVNILSDTKNQLTLEFAEEVKNFDIRKYIIDRYQEEKYPFLYDGEIDMNILDEWSKINMDFNEELCLYNNEKYLFIRKLNGILKLESIEK